MFFILIKQDIFLNRMWGETAKLEGYLKDDMEKVLFFILIK